MTLKIQYLKIKLNCKHVNNGIALLISIKINFTCIFKSDSCKNSAKLMLNVNFYKIEAFKRLASTSLQRKKRTKS